MFKCNACGKVFEEYDEIPAWRFYGAEPGPCFENVTVCPYCGDDCFEEYDEDEEEEDE